MGGKLKAVSLLAVMYALGAVSGAAWHTYHSERPAVVRKSSVDRRMNRLKKALHLSPWQEQALKEIINDAHERAVDVHDQASLDVAQIHDDSLEAIRALLTPEQQELFEKLHDRSHAQHPANKASKERPASVQSIPSDEAATS